ncbi:hypothetical protein [Agromyces sp. NPDC058110]|uniref:hypothetical protein n=1 Tax=Agromyces sp. NPDC058110 TaxID=3346345 RepID=UPI0036DD7AF2
MEVEELLARAWGAVEKAGIPEALQEYAFKEALARLSSPVPTVRLTQAATAAVPAVDVSDDGSASSTATPVLSDQELFRKFSQESGVPVDQLERIYYFDNGVPHLNGPKSKFGSNVADQARGVALALTAAYDYALDEQNLAASTVRVECERLKCAPGKNWGKVMNLLTTVNYIGAAGKKTMRTKGDTAESLQKLVKNALGIAE